MSSIPTAHPGIPGVGGTRPRRRRRLRPATLVAVVFLAVVVVAAVLAPWLAPADPSEQDVRHAFASPSWSHLLGTDDLGRDMLSRLMHGARVSLQVGVLAVGGALLIALPVGLTIGYLRGPLDTVVMRVVDAGLSVPAIVLALAIAAVLGPGVGNIIVALVIVMTPGLIRLIRGQALAVREETFIEASRSIGTQTWRILAKPVLRNVASPVIVQVAYLLGAVLIIEASLSYLGLGVQPPQASWGNMLRRAYETALFTKPWFVVVPGAAIALTVLAFNEVSDGLRDAIASSGSGQHAGSGRGRRGITTVRTRPAEGERASTLAASDDLLWIDRLGVEFETARGPVTAVEDVSLRVRPGEVLGLVGESGCGKTVTAMSVLGLLSSPPAAIVSGRVMFEGSDLLQASFEDLRRIRGKEIGMVFQDPMSSLDPSRTVGRHLVDAQRAHASVPAATARNRATELLDLVGIPSPALRLHDHPHQLSGGMRQRVMIALALVNEPKLLIADEPTTALDVTIQAQILELLADLQSQLDLSAIVVTHDLGVVAQLCDQVAVMYAGQVVETSAVDDLLRRPLHPYTAGLLRSMPQTDHPSARLPTIPGVVPAMHALPTGCRFHPRCPSAVSGCSEAPLALEGRGDARDVRCLRADELTLEGVD